MPRIGPFRRKDFLSCLRRMGFCWALRRRQTPDHAEGHANDSCPEPAWRRHRRRAFSQDSSRCRHRSGGVKRVVMSCPDSYGVSECEFAETALRNRGYLGVRIEWLRTERIPDEMEAGKAIQYLRERGAKSAIILLPNYKTRRLGRVYRRLGAQSGIRVNVWSQEREFNPQRWWRSREGQKRFAEEFLRLTRLL